MNSKFLTLVILCLAFGLSAQNNQGEITFEEKVNIWKNLPEEMSGMKDQIPEFRSSKSTLLFTSTEAFFSPKERTEAEKSERRERRAGQSRRGGRGRMGGRSSKDKSYVDIAENQTLSSTEFFGKQFLVSGSLKKYAWKLTGDQKQVGEFLCQEAIYQDSTVSISAWFTPMIPVAIGPGNYAGLPGMILHMDFDDGSRTITAIDVQLKEVDKNLILKPTEGDPISSDKFEQVKEEKIKEMEAEYGGKGGRRMFIRRG